MGKAIVMEFPKAMQYAWILSFINLLQHVLVLMGLLLVDVIGHSAEMSGNSSSQNCIPSLIAKDVLLI